MKNISNMKKILLFAPALLPALLFNFLPTEVSAAPKPLKKLKVTVMYICRKLIYSNDVRNLLNAKKLLFHFRLII